MVSLGTQGLSSLVDRITVSAMLASWARFRRLSFALTCSAFAIMLAMIVTPTAVHAQCTGTYTTVTPCTQSKYVFASTTGSTATFTVKNVGRSPSDTYTLSCLHSGYVTGCTVSPASFTLALGSSQIVTVTFNTGTWTGAAGTALVFVTGSGGGGDSFTPSVQVSSPDVTIDTGAFNATDQLLSLCANGCFAGATAYSTTPFYTLDTPRNLTLMYTEERTHPRPVVYADVTPLSGTPTPTQCTLSATLNGSTISWLNGDTQIYFTGSTSKIRLAGQFDASGYTTGVYTLVITVKAIYSGGQVVSHSYTRLLAIVNESHSLIARGWTVAGQQHLYQTAGVYLITDGRGDAVIFTALGVTAVDYSTLTYDSPSSQYIRTSLTGTKSYFNTLGQLLKVVDRLGLTTTFTYSGSQLSTVTDPEWTIRGGTGTYLSLSYGTNGLSSISEVGGAAGRTTTVTVASDSTLQAITDPDGVATHFTYDASGRLATMRDRRGDTTTYLYDTHSWKLTELDLPRIAADIGGGSTTNVIPKIKDTAWVTLGVPTASTSSGAPATPIARNSVFAKIVDPIGRVTTMNPDWWGQPLAIQDPAGRWTTIFRSGTLMLPTLILEPTGGADTIQYVSNTPLISHLRLAGDSAVNYLYGAQNQVDSVWGPGQDAEYRALDATTGRVGAIRYASSTQLVASFSYDSFNRVISYQDPGLHTTAYQYDATTGSVDSASGPGGRYTVTRFDAHGRDSLTRSSGTPMVHILYDTLNRVTTTWHEGVTHDSTRVTYDALWPVRVQGPGGQVALVELNALGWATKQYSLRDTTTYRSFRYDTAGRMTSLTNRRGQRIDMTYDALDQLLTRAAGIGIPADTFGYSTNGLVQWSIRKNVSRDTLYTNLRGQPDSLVRKIAGQRYALVYTYKDSTNRTGRTVSLTDDAGIAFSQETDATHDTIPTSDSLILTGGPGAGTSFIYRNPDGNMTDLQWADPGLHLFRYWTAMHQIYLSEPFTLGGYHEAINDSAGRAYGYGSTGRVMMDIRAYTPANHFYDRRMTYDTLGRLLMVRSAVDSACSGGDTLSAGDLYSCTKYGTAVTQDSVTYDSAGNRQFPGDSSGGDQLLKGPGGTRYTYDADGNLATRVHGGVTDSLFWSPLGLLDSVASGGSTGLRHMYEYNAYGQLVRRQTKSGAGSYAVDRYFVWDGTHMVAELAYPGTSRIAQYVYYGGVDHPFAMITGNGAIGTAVVRYYYMDPVEGNVMAVMKDTITLHQLTRYTAWGLIDQRPINVLADTNRLGWKGSMYEGDSTRLYFMRNRWYDPQAGRFVSEDPIGIAGGMNLYAFANNDPINGSDPSGTCGYIDANANQWVNADSGAHMTLNGDNEFECTGSGWDDPWEALMAPVAVHGTSNDAGPGIGDDNSPLVGAGADFSGMIGAGLSGGLGVYVTSSDFGVYVRGGVGVGVDVSAGAGYIGSTSKRAFKGHSYGVCGGVLAAGGCRSTNQSGTTYSFGASVGSRDLPIPFSYHVESSYTSTFGYQDVVGLFQTVAGAFSGF